MDKISIVIIIMILVCIFIGLFAIYTYTIISQDIESHVDYSIRDYLT